MKAVILTVIMLMQTGETVTIEAQYPTYEACMAQKARLDDEYSEYKFIQRYTVDCHE